MPEATGRVAATLAVWVDDDLVTAVVSESRDFVWLERRSGWFFLPSVVIEALSVAGAIDLDALHTGIRRDERVKELVMPEYIFAELCQRIVGVAVDGERVRVERPFDPHDVLETTELTLVEVLRERGGALERREPEALCRARGMKVSSLNNRIAYSPLIEERSLGVYGLREARGGVDDVPRSCRSAHIPAARRRQAAGTALEWSSVPPPRR